jgi:flagellar basal body-associated protein FliL
MSRHSLSRKHYTLAVIIYLAVPALLAWVGYNVSHFSHLQRLNQLRYQLEDLNTSANKKSLYDLQPLSITMSTGGQSSGVVKISLSLEMNQKDLLRLPDFEPRIVERIALYLHKKSYEDMRRPGAMKDLREGLIDEIDRGAHPINVTNVIVRELVFE